MQKQSTLFSRCVRALATLCAVAAIAACGGGGGSGPPPFGGTGSGGESGGGDGGAVATSATVTLSISSTTVTATSPATVTVTLRDASNAPIAGKVVSLATGRTGLAVLSAASVLTDAQGKGTVGVQPASGGLTGADEVIATLAASSGVVTGSVGFSVTGGSATISADISATTLRPSAGPATFSATLRDEAGNPVPNQVVAFASSKGLLTLASPTALTDSSGRASTTVKATDPATNAADTLTASTTANSRDLQSSVNVQLIGESPSIALTLSNSSVSVTTPATVRAVVRDAAGATVSGAVVSFSSQFKLGVFDASTAATDATGTATVVVSPAKASTTGADFVVATTMVDGVAASTQSVAQFVGTSTSGTPVLQLALSSTSLSAASPATVTATLTDARGQPVPGQVVSFDVSRSLAKTNVDTSLTDSMGRAVVVMAPSSPNSAGADEISASVTYGGFPLQATQGFQVQATNITLDAFTADASPLSAYGQTTLELKVTGASVTSPVNITISSACVSQGKATISPASLTVTGATVSMQYRDNGCGAVQVADQLQAIVTATGAARALSLPIDAPAAASVAFVEASPETIFLRGSGFTESSVVTFEVRDAAGNPLPGRVVELRLQTGAGGVTMEGRQVESVNPPSSNPFTLTSNAQGRVGVRVNAGTLPTPVRVNAKLQSTTVSTVSSNLSVAIGLPSQLNFSLSQATKNIEGYNIDGTPNTYQIIAADRSGNPVPAGTSINFVTEGGQVEAVKTTQLVNGIARTTANFVSAEPRPTDGRVTVTTYALGEESFLDTNGNNAYDSGEPFQDLGNVFKDRNFDGVFDVNVDEYVPLTINNSSACAPITNSLLQLNPSIPSVAGTCSGTWSGAGQVYVRRAIETVLSTSAARPLWANTSGLDATCSKIQMQTGPNGQTGNFTLVSGGTWYGGVAGTLGFIIADANPGNPQASPIQPPRLNPMAAGTTVSVSTPTKNFTVALGGGSPVPSTTEATLAAVTYEFTDPGTTSGVIFVTFRSPSGTATTFSVAVQVGAPATACP